MFDIQKFIADKKVEKFENFKFQYNSGFSQFNTNETMVIFFDLGNNPIINQYIKSNIESIKQRFSEQYKNFVYLPSIEFSKINQELLNFYIPYLDATAFNFRLLENEIGKVFSDDPKISYKTDYQNILDYFGYSKDIKCGLLFFDYCNAYCIDCSDLTLKNNQDSFFVDLLLYFKTAREEEEQVDYMICNPPNHYENLDEDALTKIREIQKQLSELKQNGQLLFALPVLKELLENETNTIDIDSENNLVIDENFRLLLPNFNNIEIQLSHLTKAIYVLFYNNPQGINIKNLYAYKKEIISIYAGISNQLDYDKMLQSIDDLIKPDSKAIYTHISRIKAAFYKQMDYKFADKFIVTSANFGNDYKFIPILKNKIDPEKEFHPNVTFDL